MNNQALTAAPATLASAVENLAKACRKWFRISDDMDEAGSDRHQSIAHEIIEATAGMIKGLKGPLTVEVWSVTIENPSGDAPATFVVEDEKAAYGQVRAYCAVSDGSLSDGDMLAQLQGDSGYAIHIDSHLVITALSRIGAAPLGSASPTPSLSAVSA